MMKYKQGAGVRSQSRDQEPRQETGIRAATIKQEPRQKPGESEESDKLPEVRENCFQAGLYR